MIDYHESMMARFSVEEEGEPNQNQNPNQRRKKWKKTIRVAAEVVDKKEWWDPKRRRTIDESSEEIQNDREEPESEDLESAGDEDGDDDDLAMERSAGDDPDSSGSTSHGITATIDPDLLDCSICFEPLIPPIFQCKSGHVACPTCCSKLQNKCHICSLPTGYNRCHALEAIIKSIKVPCTNSKYGCKKTICYSETRAHEEMCVHAPFQCPVDHCNFCGSVRTFSSHVNSEHDLPIRSYRYEQYLVVIVTPTDRFVVLQGEDDNLFILIKNDSQPLGCTLSMACIHRQKNPGFVFSYYLQAFAQGSYDSSLSLRAPMESIQNSYPPKVFLMVPNCFHNSAAIRLTIHIVKAASK